MRLIGIFKDSIEIAGSFSFWKKTGPERFSPTSGGVQGVQGTRREPALETPCHRAASSPPPTSHVARANRPPPWPLTRLLSLACLLLLLRAMDLGSFASDDEILPQDFIAESCICGHLLESRVKADWSGRVLLVLSMLSSTPPLISETFSRPLVRVHCRRFALCARSGHLRRIFIVSDRRCRTLLAWSQGNIPYIDVVSTIYVAIHTAY